MQKGGFMRERKWTQKSTLNGDSQFQALNDLQNMCHYSYGVHTMSSDTWSENHLRHEIDFDNAVLIFPHTFYLIQMF